MRLVLIVCFFLIEVGVNIRIDNSVINCRVIIDWFIVCGFFLWFWGYFGERGNRFYVFIWFLVII